MNHRYLPIILIVLIGISLYAHTASFELVNLDDSRYVVANYNFNKDLSNMRSAFRENINYPSGYSAYYRPLQAISHIIDTQLSGPQPKSFHVTNMIIHILNALLLFVFLELLGHKKFLSILFSLLFISHPLLVGAVAWIPGRIDSMLALFVLSSFIFFIRYLHSLKFIDLIAHSILLLLALFTKELAVLVPLLAGMYVLTTNIQLKLREKIRVAAAWIIPLIIWAVLLQSAVGHLRTFTIFDISKLILANINATFIYLGKMLFLYNLSALATLQDTTIYIGIIGTVILLLALFFGGVVRIKVAILGLIWFLFFLLPSFYTDDATTVSIFMEHRSYLPLIGLIILILESKLLQKLLVGTKVIFAVGIILISIFSYTTYNHSLNFKDRLSFWSHAVETSPSLPKAHGGLGAAQFVLGDVDSAERSYKNAIELSPDERRIHGNLGLLYMESGRIDEAEKEFKRELELNSISAETHLNLGVLYYGHKQEYELAHDEWEQALQLNPVLWSAHEYLAVYHYEISKDLERSVFHINSGINIRGTTQPALLEVLKEAEQYGIN
jgi:protein O-mannosyl-transferase